MMEAKDYVDVGIGGGATTDVSATNYSCGKDEETPLVTTSEMWLESSPSVGPFRSTYTCKDSKIQGILRSISWSDPFYEHPTMYTGCCGSADDSIIAVFDSNAKPVRDSFELACICLGAALFMALLTALTQTEEEFYERTQMWANCFSLLLGLVQVEGAISLRKELNMIGCRHVAVTTRGIYLDASTDVHTHQVAERSIIPYDTIDTCTIDEIGVIQPVYQVSIVLNRFDASGLAGFHTRLSLSSGQAFVDLVNALMEQAKAKVTANQGADATAAAVAAAVIGTAGVSAAAPTKECV